MATAWIKKRQSATSPPDKVFMKNFMREFLEQLQNEYPNLNFLADFAKEYLQKIETADDKDICNPNSAIHHEIDFNEILDFVKQEKLLKETMTPAEKKQKAAERKA
ncbi:MAG: hypothetical protein N3E52_03335, partial [Candidatus Bathyarchaeota archaeon]|nr:hypothetical protein [Candidatus Bathyarchaeota archaeon]